MSYLDCLSEACGLSQVGFHFEEGGCFAMAVAIHDALLEDGHEPRLAFDRSAAHAFAEADLDLYDHQGRRHTRAGIEYVTRDGMRDLALSSGHSEEDFEIDLRDAMEIVGSARELETERRKLVGWISANLGFDDGDAESLFDTFRNRDNADYLYHVVGSDHLFAALECGSHVYDGDIDEMLPSSTVGLVRKAFRANGGGESLRTLVDAVRERGVWGATETLIQNATQATQKPSVF